MSKAEQCCARRYQSIYAKIYQLCQIEPSQLRQNLLIGPVRALHHHPVIEYKLKAHYHIIVTHFCKYWYVYLKASLVKLKFSSSSISDALAMSKRGACASRGSLRMTVHRNKNQYNTQIKFYTSIPVPDTTPEMSWSILSFGPLKLSISPWGYDWME